MGRAAHTERDSSEGSTRRGQRVFLSEYYEDGLNLLVVRTLTTLKCTLVFGTSSSISVSSHSWNKSIPGGAVTG